MISKVFPYLAAGAGLCFVGYCIYFDRKRRSHPDFRENLRKKRQQQVVESQKASSIPVPPVNDPEAMQKFFLEQIQQGETALTMGSVDEGIQHFAIAVSVCGQPSQLLQVLRQSLSPPIFMRLLEVLPSIQAIRFGILLILIVFKQCQSDRDPYDMFNDPISDLKQEQHDGDNEETSIEKSKLFVDQTNSKQLNRTLEHYRELHKVLVRILWHTLNLQSVENMNLNDVSTQLRFTLILNKNDINLLSDYCNPNQTISNQVSADIINNIFSKSIHPILGDDVSFLTLLLSDRNLFWFSSFVCLVLFVMFAVLVNLVRNKFFFLFYLIPFVIFGQTLYRKYTYNLARKMSVLSQSDGPPNSCDNKKTWFQSIKYLLTTRPSYDECTAYYEQVLTEPWLATSIYETLLDILFQPILSLFVSFGHSIGLFYHTLAGYVPFYLNFLLLVCCIIIFILILPSTLLSIIQRFRTPAITSISSTTTNATGNNNHNGNKRKNRHKIKSNSIPSITNS